MIWDGTHIDFRQHSEFRFHEAHRIFNEGISGLVERFGLCVFAPGSGWMSLGQIAIPNAAPRRARVNGIAARRTAGARLHDHRAHFVRFSGR